MKYISTAIHFILIAPGSYRRRRYAALLSVFTGWIFNLFDLPLMTINDVKSDYVG